MTNGWIKIHRKFTQWEWYDDINTKVLFLHLLITANYEDKNWRGVNIKRGQKVTSLPNLAKETCLTIRNVRTSLDRLKSTGELTDQSTNRFRLITICNYDEYQSEVTDETTGKLTGSRQASDRQTTATKEVKKEKKTNKKNTSYSKKKFIIPSLTEIEEYCTLRGNGLSAAKFFDFYESKGWKVGNSPMKNWQAAVRTWESNEGSSPSDGYKINGKEVSKIEFEAYISRSKGKIYKL